MSITVDAMFTEESMGDDTMRIQEVKEWVGILIE
jgi:hypothetical protein